MSACNCTGKCNRVLGCGCGGVLTLTAGPSVEPEPSRTVPDAPQWKQIVAGNIVIAQGWECPRCKLILGPHVSSCSCQKLTVLRDGNTTTMPLYGTFTGQE